MWQEKDEVVECLEGLKESMSLKIQGIGNKLAVYFNMLKSYLLVFKRMLMI